MKNKFEDIMRKLKRIIMKKNNLAISIICLISLLSCHSTDFSNPEEVVKTYRKLRLENAIVYDDYISSKSKEYVTKDEFVKNTTDLSDSVRKSTKLIERNILSLPMGANSSTYRRFKVEEKVFRTDTIYRRFYYSLINENGKWKIIWYNTLLDFAQNLFRNGNYSEARKTYEKIIEIDPFSGKAYNGLAWAYLRDGSLPDSERENGIVKNVKYAITLEEDENDYYNTFSAYYSSIGNEDLAIHYLERGLLFCINKYHKANVYANLAGRYIAIRNFEKAEEYLNKSIEIDDENAHPWFLYGNLMLEQGNTQKAIAFYEKALEQDKMLNALQGDLYYYYAFCCYHNSYRDKALEYVIKALDIAPNNQNYQSFYNQIKQCE